MERHLRRSLCWLAGWVIVATYFPFYVAGRVAERMEKHLAPRMARAWKWADGTTPKTVSDRYVHVCYREDIP